MEVDEKGDGAAGNTVAPAESRSGDYEIPSHAMEALARAKDFGEFRSLRCLRFLHLFSGPKDMIGNALRRLAEGENLKVDVLSMDKLGEGNVDLLKEHPFVDILDEAEKHSFDAAHAGFPCGSFSKARYNEGHGPKPVRSLEHIYGLPSNSEPQQREADRGTVLAVRSVEIIKTVIKSQRKRRVPQAGTLENPPGSESQFEGPAWKLPEIVKFMDVFRLETAIFNTCSYMSKQKTRWYNLAGSQELWMV